MIYLILIAIIGVGFQIAVTIYTSNVIVKNILPGLKTAESKREKVVAVFVSLLLSIIAGVSIAVFWKIMIIFAWSIK